MFDTLLGFEIRNDFFNENTSLELFSIGDKKNLGVCNNCLIYGRNGSGKTTISRYLKNSSDNESENIFIFKENHRALNEIEKKNIYVFNEDFIEENIRLEEKTLKSIIIFGEQVDLTNEIEKVKDDLSKNDNDYELKKYEFENNYNKGEKSPNSYSKKIKERLKGDHSWAGRDKNINSSKINTSVNGRTYERFKENKYPDLSIEQLIILFNKKLDILENARSGSLKINKPVEKISIESKYEKLKELLEMKIEKPHLNEREKVLMNLVENRNSKMLNDIKETFKKDINKCPYCFQDVTSEYKNSLVESIEKVLSDEVDRHIESLKECFMEEINMDLDIYIVLKQDYDNCKNLIVNINNKIMVNNDSLRKKIDNPYLPIKQHMDITNDIQELESKLKILEQSRNTYNEKATDLEPIKSELRCINDSIAFLEIQEDVKKMHFYEEEKESKKQELDKLEKYIKKIREKYNELNEKRKNIKIAENIINQDLQYIFFKKNRLEIKCNDGSYEILSNGKFVEPKKISVGERNAIALSYFFTTIMENKELDNKDNTNYFIAIDDPVSSFDTENKIGILSFLRYKINQINLEKPGTKMIILTHDLSVYYDLESIFQDLDCKKIKVNKFELVNKNIKKFETKNKRRDEYTILINKIYDYANNIDTDMDIDIVVGNMMRQVLEAFSTFGYKKGIADISTNECILNILKNKDNRYSKYFENLMYRLILHGTSHKESQVHTLKDMNFYEVISPEEKQKTARDIICFLYLINKEHVLSHLGYYKENKKIDFYVDNIEEWCKKILEL